MTFNLNKYSIRDLEFTRRIFSIDHDLNLYQGKHNSRDIFIFEIQHVSSPEDFDVFFKQFPSEDDQICHRIGLCCDNIKCILYVLYTYPSSRVSVCLLQDVKELTLHDKYTYSIALLEAMEHFHIKYNTPITWITPWNVIVDKDRQKVYFIEPFLARFYYKGNDMSKYRDVKYLPPERFCSEVLNVKSDSWNIGLFIVEFFGGESLYDHLFLKNREEIVKFLMGSTTFKFQPKENLIFSPLSQIKDVLANCLTHSPELRLSVTDIKALMTTHSTSAIDNKIISNGENVEQKLNTIRQIFQAELNYDTYMELISKQRETIASFKRDADYNIKQNCKILKDLIDELERSQIEQMDKLEAKFSKRINDEEIKFSSDHFKLRQKFTKVTEEFERNYIAPYKDNNLSALDDVSAELQSKTNELIQMSGSISLESTWHKQFLHKMTFIRKVDESVTENLLENITLAKYCSLLKSDDYSINDDLLVKYLNDNFFFVNKNIPELHEVLNELAEGLNVEGGMTCVESYLKNNMQRGREEILNKVYQLLEGKFEDMLRWNMDEIKVLIYKEKVHQVETPLTVTSLLIDTEREIEERIEAIVSDFMKLNKDTILMRLSLSLVSEMLVQTLSESFNLEANRDVIMLNLGGLCLGPDGWGIFVDILNQLSKNKKIGTLNLKGNLITDDGVGKLALMLKGRFYDITTLNISNNMLSSIGACKISESLSNQHTLSKLSISSNNLSPDGIKSLSLGLCRLPNLTVLDLTETGMYEDGMEHLCRIYLSVTTTLNTISLKDNHIADKGLTYFTDAITTNKKLKLNNISLSSNEITGNSLICLLPALKSTVEQLDLSLNPLGDGIRKTMSVFIKGNNQLVNLSIAGCGISYEEIKEIISTASRSNFVFEVLSIEGNNFDVEQVSELIEGSNRLSKILKYKNENKGEKNETPNEVTVEISNDVEEKRVEG